MITLKNITGIAVIAAFLAGCVEEQKREPVDYVNPYMGNISHLLVPTYPTVHLPNSMLRVTPMRREYTSMRVSGLCLSYGASGKIGFWTLSVHRKRDSGKLLL